ncbi:hypothetical protein [Azospirillum sp. B2RO_4]|uniref:hypothetical protein n=1 Tax=Azospirillum sp. B2RO_4 TaxID=3027796 RepID=UPI003DA88154
MPSISGNTVVVLEPDAILRLGVEALLDFWGCKVIAGDGVEDLLMAIRAEKAKPTLLLLPPVIGAQTGDQMAARFEAEVGCALPWIGITGDLGLLKRWRAGEIRGTLLEMPCSPETLRAAMVSALQERS